MATSPGFYEAVYALLAQQGQLRFDPLTRSAFVEYFSGSAGVKEWRFQGDLGFGGKFWFRYQGHDFTCYPEDLTNERIELMKRLNDKIKALEQEYGVVAQLG